MKNNKKPGKVYLVGAGPGDPLLITVKGMDLIKNCDVLIHDHLASAYFTSEVKEDCQLIYVGKEASKHTLTQTEINKLLIKKAKEGKLVVRLKGGDPYLFGRGGEEALDLFKAKIKFEVVPGISSSLAAAAYAGIPVTHRKVASSMTIATGHEDPTKLKSSLKFEHLAQGADTLIFLMGVSNLKFIVSKLKEQGLSEHTKICLISWATTPKQKVVNGNLKNIVEVVAKSKIKPPAIILVGEVISLRKKLNWFENLSLFGKNIIITRPLKQAKTFFSALIERGAQPILLPAIKILEIKNNLKLKNELHNLQKYHYIIFTSVNAVEIFFKNLFKENLDSRSLTGIKIYAIGEKTAQSILNFGIKVDKVPSKFVSEEIIKMFSSSEIKDKNILIPRAQMARDILIKELTKMGGKVKVLPIYKTVKENTNVKNVKELLKEKKIDYCTFTSSSTVENTIKLLGKDYLLLNHTKVIAIGPITAKTLQQNKIKIHKIASKHTVAGIIEVLEGEKCA